MVRQTELPAQTYSSPHIVKKHSLPASFGTLTKRRNLLEEHSHCSNGIRLAINFLKTEQTGSLNLGHLIFQKVEEKLRKIAAGITSSDIDVEDISSTIASELKQVEKYVSDMREELQACNSETCQLTDYKNFLRARFRERNDHNLRLWYEMLQFVRGERMPTS